MKILVKFNTFKGLEWGRKFYNNTGKSFCKKVSIYLDKQMLYLRIHKL